MAIPSFRFSAREPHITWFIIFLALIGLLGANILWLVPSINDARDNAARVRLEIAGRAADSITTFIAGRIDALQNAADQLRFHQESSKEILNRVLKEYPEFNTISLADKDFTEYTRISRFEVAETGLLRIFPELSVLSFNSIPGSFYLGSVVRDQHLEPLIIVAVPVRFSANDSNAYLVAELNLRFLSEVVTRFRFGDTGKVYIFDRDGTLIVDPNLSLVLQHPTLRERPIVRLLLGDASQVSIATYENEENISVDASGILLPEFRWGIVSEQYSTEANALRNKILLLALISILIGVLLLTALVVNAQKLVGANLRLREILHENYESAKMLVRRDLELTRANTAMQGFLIELDSVGKMLVRRDLELTQANARLEELDQVKSEFVTIAAHQLRTPLTGIRWSYQAMLEEPSGALTSEQRKILEGGLSASLRMIDLVNDLLSVARIEEGRFGFHFMVQSPSTLIIRLAEEAQKTAAEKGIDFSVKMPERALPPVSFDEEKLALVLGNIMDNAVKYTAPGGKVTLLAERADSTVTITVTDTGIGIPAGQLHRVFSKFFRADNALRFHTSGTGLGLYVAKNIVEKHDGTMTVKSTEAKGTTVTVALPIAKPI